MVKAEFGVVGGVRVFVVGGALKKTYSTAPGQEEVYRNGEISLHVVPANGDWVTARIYLIAGPRRKVWHIGVNLAERRAASVSDSYHLRVENPALLSWAVEYVLGRRDVDAPPVGCDAHRPASRDDWMRVIDMVEEAAQDGAGWSLAPNTRKRGRYVVDRVRRQMPWLPEKDAEHIVLRLVYAGVLKSVMRDSHTRQCGLMVFREHIPEAMRRAGFEEGEGK